MLHFNGALKRQENESDTIPKSFYYRKTTKGVSEALPHRCHPLHKRNRTNKHWRLRIILVNPLCGIEGFRTASRATTTVPAVVYSGGIDRRDSQVRADYTMYYETKRGFHPRSLNSVGGWNKTNALSFIKLPFLKRSNEIQSAVLIVHGDQAHSYYFSKDAYANMMQDGNSVAAKAGNKEFLSIKGASHTDLYDQTDIIPFDKIAKFYTKYLK